MEEQPHILAWLQNTSQAKELLSGDEDHGGNIGVVMFSLGEEKTAVKEREHCHVKIL